MMNKELIQEIEKEIMPVLLSLSVRTPIVHRHLRAWEAGCFDSYGEMIASIIISLSKENKEYIELLEKYSSVGYPISIPVVDLGKEQDDKRSFGDK